MTKHVHAEMIKAKADNMELVVISKRSDEHWRIVGGWPEWFQDREYFLCLQQHKEACLHWLNGGEVQYENQKCQGGWGSVSSIQDEIEDKAEDMECSIDELSDFNPTKWCNESIFMRSDFCLRIKPRKEKRWIGVCECDCTPRNFKSIDDARFWVDHNAGKNSDYWQFIEIEVEV